MGHPRPTLVIVILILPEVQGCGGTAPTRTRELCPGRGSPPPACMQHIPVIQIIWWPYSNLWFFPPLPSHF